MRSRKTGTPGRDSSVEHRPGGALVMTLTRCPSRESSNARRLTASSSPPSSGRKELGASTMFILLLEEPDYSENSIEPRLPRMLSTSPRVAGRADPGGLFRVLQQPSDLCRNGDSDLKNAGGEKDSRMTYSRYSYKTTRKVLLRDLKYRSNLLINML